MRKHVVGILVLLVVLAGCTNGPSVVGCGDNALAVIDYNVNPLAKVYPGDIVTFVFWLGNQGSYDAENIEVKFFDRQGFEVEEMRCDDGSGMDNGCRIDKIEAGENCQGDIKEVYAELRAPDKGEKTVSFSVNYDYKGNSKLLFSIWKKGVEDQWGSKQESSTHGPVKVDIDSEFLLQRIVHDQEETVTEWLEEDQKFTLNLNVRNTGAVSGKIDKDNFKVRFNYLTPITDDNCDLKKEGNHYIPKKDVEVPTKKPLKCDVVANDIDQEWVTGSIEVEYDYEYKFIRQQKFKIE